MVLQKILFMCKFLLKNPFLQNFPPKNYKEALSKLFKSKLHFQESFAKIFVFAKKCLIYFHFCKTFCINFCFCIHFCIMVVNLIFLLLFLTFCKLFCKKVEKNVHEIFAIIPNQKFFFQT
jgi:hypothetical protein